MNGKIFSRRSVLQAGLIATAAIPFCGISKSFAAEETQPEQKTPVTGSRRVNPQSAKGSVAKVYFSPVIDAASLIRLYNLVNVGIYGKVAIKVHPGEPNGPNILPRDMVVALQKTIPDSSIVETNTLYEGARNATADHGKTLDAMAGLFARWTFSMSMEMSICQSGMDFISRKWLWAKE